MDLYFIGLSWCNTVDDVVVIWRWVLRNLRECQEFGSASLVSTSWRQSQCQWGHNICLTYAIRGQHVGIKSRNINCASETCNSTRHILADLVRMCVIHLCIFIQSYLSVRVVLVRMFTTKSILTNRTPERLNVMFLAKLHQNRDLGTASRPYIFKSRCAYTFGHLHPWYIPWPRQWMAATFMAKATLKACIL